MAAADVTRQNILSEVLFGADAAMLHSFANLLGQCRALCDDSGQAICHSELKHTWALLRFIWASLRPAPEQRSRLQTAERGELAALAGAPVSSLLSAAEARPVVC